MSLQAAALYALVSVMGADKSVRDLKRVSGQVESTMGVMSGLARNAGQIGRGVGQVAGGLVRIGQYAAIAAAGAGVAVAKTAMDFEDAFATVEKTVEGTPQALEAIDKGLRKLSTTIPVTFQELATIASEAGALGIATKDIENFTEAVARTSAASVGLDPFTASEAFGKLSTIFTLHADVIDKKTGELVSDYERLGSVLVDLGRKGASSESEIIDTAKYFSGVGQAAGLSAAQVLAWGSAVVSVTGAEPEAAGGALQRVFQRLTTQIGTANPKLKAVATAAKMTTKEFAKAFDEDATGAVIRFLGGLKDLNEFQAAAALKEAGIINQRDVRVITGLSQHIPILTYQLDVASKAWAENTALMEVSETRFDTLKAHLTELHNTVKLGAAAIGDGMNPALGRLVEKAKDFLNLHMKDFGNLGTDIGHAIDSIDWAKVNAGATTAVDLAKTLLTIISKIPPEILAGVSAFTVLNRVSGGLLGAGLGNIAGGLAGIPITLARGALANMGPVGKLLASATALHVWVDNMPLGGFGGIPALPTAGAAGAAGAGGVGTATLTAAAALLVAPIALAITRQMSGDPNVVGGSRGFFPGQKPGPGMIGYQPPPYGPPTPRGWATRGAEMFGPPTPGTAGNLAARGIDARSRYSEAAIFLRAVEAGRGGRGGPSADQVNATLQRNILRAAEAQKTAIDRTTTAAQQTRDAVGSLANKLPGASNSGTINLTVTVPAVKSYAQEIQKAIRYGPLVPNGPRYQGTHG